MDPSRSIENRVDRYIHAESLLAPGAKVAVGVSGGPDSSALLLILARLARRRSWQVRAAYFDHQLRGPEAGATEKKAVVALARIAGVDLVCGSADVRGLVTGGHGSLEDAARRARYDFLGEAVGENGVVA